MWYFLIVIIIIAIGFIIYAYLHPVIAKNKFQTRLEAFLTEHEVSYQLHDKDKNLPFDYTLEIGDHTYFIKVIIIPSYSEIIVNAKNTWELRYGAGTTPGKVHPIKRYLPKMDAFMEYQTTHRRVIVFVPKTMKKVKYVNESEMVFIKPNTNVYGVSVLNDDELEYFIDKKKAF